MNHFVLSRFWKTFLAFLRIGIQSQRNQDPLLTPWSYKRLKLVRRESQVSPSSMIRLRKSFTFRCFAKQTWHNVRLHKKANLNTATRLAPILIVLATLVRKESKSFVGTVEMRALWRTNIDNCTIDCRLCWCSRYISGFGLLGAYCASFERYHAKPQVFIRKTFLRNEIRTAEV